MARRTVVSRGDGFRPGRTPSALMRNRGAGFALVPSAQTGLVANGTGVACTVGDFDNDGLPTLL